MTLQTFLNSMIPCHENGIESIAGGLYIFLVFIMSILYLLRPINRRAIRRHIFGIHYKDEPNEIDRLIAERTPYKMTIIWHYVMYHSIRYAFGLFGLYISFKGHPKTYTHIWAWTMMILAGYSIPMGSHRLYSHRAFKANTVYQLIMVFLHTIVQQSSVIHWARDHRTHHKFLDTNADPYNAKRGLFFTQIGWLNVERHPDVLRQGRKIDISDLTSNWIVAYQRRFFPIIAPGVYVFLMAIPIIFWGESFWICYFRVVEYPYVVMLTITSFINSWAHYGGVRPYNSKITASDGGYLRNLICLGEGYHNFHHTFPHDYRSADNSESALAGNFIHWFTTSAGNFIYFLSLVGVTWDLKKANPNTVNRAKTKGNFKEELYW